MEFAVAFLASLLSSVALIVFVAAVKRSRVESKSKSLFARWIWIVRFNSVMDDIYGDEYLERSRVLLRVNQRDKLLLVMRPDGVTQGIDDAFTQAEKYQLYVYLTELVA